MRYLRSNRFGYSLIEVILVLALMGIVFIPINTFFISSLKYYNRAANELELQYQAQIGMNELIDKIITTQGINNISFYDAEKGIVSKMVFNNSLNGDIHQQKIVIEQKENGLFLGYSNTATVVFANHISQLMVNPLPFDSKYEDCKGISITLKTKKKDSEMVITNNIFFRN